MTAQWQEIRDQLLGEMDLSHDISDEELKKIIERGVAEYGKTHLLSLGQREFFEMQIFNSFRKLDILQELLDDAEVTEIMVNGPKQIFFEKRGCIYPWKKGELSEEKLRAMIQQIVASANRTVNEAQPIVDARLPDGSRVNIVLPPVSIDGAVVSIRKFSAEPMTLDRLVRLGSISRHAAEFLRLLVCAGYNIFVSGGTGSGKTTFLNALSECIPREERVVTIEDSAELQMHGIGNLVRLEARNGNESGSEPITIRDLIKTALRMRPDRIIVGEVRGAEALDMLQAMNTGHDGSLSTGHANSSRDMLGRLETMVLMGIELPVSAIRRQIASGIDILVHLGRMRDKTRKVLHIAELDSICGDEICLRTLYRFQETEGKEDAVCGVWKQEASLRHCGKIRAKGLEGAFQRLETCFTEDGNA